MRIILEVESLRFWKTFERLVPGDFMDRCEFHSALRNDMAVIFDRSNVVMESVDFLEIQLDDERFWVNFLGVCQRINVRRILLLRWCLPFLCGLDHDHWVSSREWLTCHLFQELWVVLIQLAEWLKNHLVLGTAPVEFLVWEFVVVFVADAHGDVVVSAFDSANSAPEK